VSAKNPNGMDEHVGRRIRVSLNRSASNFSKCRNMRMAKIGSAQFGSLYSPKYVALPGAFCRLTRPAMNKNPPASELCTGGPGRRPQPVRYPERVDWAAGPSGMRTQ
jgi:hypothetical protein